MTLLALGGLAFWLVFYSPALDVDEVRVAGLNHTDLAQVAAITDQLLGDPLVTADLDGARKLILELPWVQAAELSRSWRKGIVHIDILERTPVAVLLRDGSYSLLDREGRVLQRQAEPGKHLLIESSDWQRAASGHYESAVGALQVAEEVAKHPKIMAQLASISETSGDLFLKLMGDGWVYLNDARDLPAKMKSVETFLEHTAIPCGKILDVNSAVAPVIREGALCQA